MIITFGQVKSNKAIDKSWKNKYESITENYYQSYSLVVQNGKYGFVDKNGVITTPLIYDYLYGSILGLSGAEINSEDGKRIKGYISIKTGKVIIPIIYDEAYHEQNGIFYAKKNGEIYRYNSSGKCIEGCTNKTIAKNSNTSQGNNRTKTTITKTKEPEKLLKTPENYRNQIELYNKLAQEFVVKYKNEISPNTGKDEKFAFHPDDYDLDEREVTLGWLAGTCRICPKEPFLIYGKINIKTMTFNWEKNNAAVSNASNFNEILRSSKSSSSDSSSSNYSIEFDGGWSNNSKGATRDIKVYRNSEYDGSGEIEYFYNTHKDGYYIRIKYSMKSTEGYHYDLNKRELSHETFGGYGSAFKSGISFDEAINEVINDFKNKIR
ncbi:hypothetical protein B0A58_11660 [Flavobacterium branchiophilum NBRC 15030 = ATCC 35035]|nr:hypothetical protein B0A58_11660 [Flavobacterium branchiophilum NBRC 15030 = ATCC 35035]